MRQLLPRIRVEAVLVAPGQAEAARVVLRQEEAARRLPIGGRLLPTEAERPPRTRAPPQRTRPQLPRRTRVRRPPPIKAQLLQRTRVQLPQRTRPQLPRPTRVRRPLPARLRRLPLERARRLPQPKGQPRLALRARRPPLAARVRRMRLPRVAQLAVRAPRRHLRRPSQPRAEIRRAFQAVESLPSRLPMVQRSRTAHTAAREWRDGALAAAG